MKHYYSNFRIWAMTLILVAGSIQILTAQGGIYETYFKVNKDGTHTWYGTGGNPTFNGVNLGSVNSGTTLQFLDRGINTWNEVSNGSSVTSATLNYRVYKQGTSAPGFTQVSLPQNGSSGNNKFWNMTGPAINLLSGITGVTGNVFNIELYWEAGTNSVNIDPIVYASNGGLNFTATFTLSGNLPVVLTSFGAEKTGSSSIRLAWETASEYNNDRFEIERSGDARQWTTIGAVATQDGDSRSALQYTFDDRQPLAGTNYYRLRQVDRDNSSTLSRMVKVAMNTRASISVSPNPVRAGQSVTVAFPDAPEVSTVRLYNAYGTLLRTWTISTDQATHELDLSGITPGLLVVECGAQTVKLIKE